MLDVLAPPEFATATNIPNVWLQQTEVHVYAAAAVLTTQVIPFELLIIHDVLPDDPTATNNDNWGLQHTENHAVLLGAVLTVQSIPFGDVIILVLEVPLLATAVNNNSSGLQHTDDQFKADVEFLEVQFTPSGDVNTLSQVTAINKLNSDAQHIEYTRSVIDVVVKVNEDMFLIGLD